MLTQPSWVPLDDLTKRRIRFVWDDTRAMRDFAADASVVLRGSMKMSLRARLVLCAGLYEWNVWRFAGLHDRPEPLQISEVAWCATVDPRYMRYFDLMREEWLGPIQGPLWCAAMWLQPAMSNGHMFPRSVYEALSFLTRMALHVLPDREPFDSWLAAALDRLVEMYPLPPEEPFDDLFDRRVGQRLGPLIGRNVLDPEKAYDPSAGVNFLAHILREARATENPFLSSSEDLEDVGFVDEPYVLPI